MHVDDNNGAVWTLVRFCDREQGSEELVSLPELSMVIKLYMDQLVSERSVSVSGKSVERRFDILMQSMNPWQHRCRRSTPWGRLRIFDN